MFHTSYSKVAASEDDGPPLTRSDRKWWQSLRGWSVLGSVVVLALLIFIGVKAALSDKPKFGIPLDETTVELKYAPIFGGPRTPSAKDAWSSLFPERGGFLIHPDIAPKSSAVSVFHQLHCLDAIRVAYWDLFGAATTGVTVVEADIPEMTSPQHVTHCIDLIRQVLMCYPDLTMEPELSIGGVAGFGMPRQCKNFDQLIDWVSQWENYGRITSDNESEHSNAH